MTAIVLLLIAVIAPQVWAIRAGRSAALRVLLFGVSLAVGTALLLSPIGLMFLSRTPEPQVYHDTYYVVAHGHYIASQLALLAFLWALLAAAARWSRHLTRVAKPLATLMALAGAVVLFQPVLMSSSIGMPHRFTDYEASMSRQIWLSAAATFVYATSYLTLAALSLYALLRRTVKGAD